MRVEMIHGRNYHFRDHLFKRYADDGTTVMQYEVDGILAKELLDLKTPRDIPYFRLVMSEEEIEQREAELEAEEPPVVEVVRDPTKDARPVDPNVVTVKSRVKKKAKKKIVKKKTPARVTSSDEGEDNAADEV